MPASQTHTKFYKGRIHFPFSIWYIGSCWNKENVTLWDMNTSSIEPDYKRFDEVGISCMTAHVPQVVRLAKKIRQANPKISLTVGGIHPTLYHDQTWNSGLFDHIVSGHEIQDFPNMPMLDYSLLDKQMMKQKKNFVGLITSIGCPFQCTFCVNSVTSLYNKWQAWSAERICDEIEKAQSLGFKNVFFWDDNFFVNKRRIEDFIRLVDKRKLHFEWFAYTRADEVDRELFKNCQRIGLRRVSIGGESGSDKVLRRLCKQTTVDRLEKSARILDELGIEASYSYMIGLPNEEPEHIPETIKHLQRMSTICTYPKIIGPMVYCPYPGSKLYKEAVSYGWKQPEKLEDWSDSNTGFGDIDNLPWIKNKDKTKIYWFYSFLIPLSFKKIFNLWTLYFKRVSKSILIFPILFAGAVVGKLRHQASFYKYPIEVKLFKKLRGLLGS